MRLTLMVVLTVLGWVMPVAAEPPAPVDPVTQCQAFVELVIKDRAHAQTEAAYFAVRTQDLQAQVKALEAKVKELEAKK